ncbi:MAG TPA: BlaI/MecI/CopY family transcriptional regulator, partial [Thermoanaerobaculia bacterium]|nr:BlaI/MecI/CopY family transcriptional regulator [Thermoanaerobaculia bacterium]
MDETISLGPRELEVMQALWSQGAPVTVREVHRSLAGGGSDLAYTTVQTMLNRLEEKGYVARERAGRAHRYGPLLAQERAVGGAVEGLVERFFAGSAAALAAHLVEGELAPTELERLR